MQARCKPIASPLQAFLQAHCEPSASPLQAQRKPFASPFAIRSQSVHSPHPPRAQSGPVPGGRLERACAPTARPRNAPCAWAP
eukprot:15379704-Alexandrium_andersonii.AAC.1